MNSSSNDVGGGTSNTADTETALDIEVGNTSGVAPSNNLHVALQGSGGDGPSDAPENESQQHNSKYSKGGEDNEDTGSVTSSDGGALSQHWKISFALLIFLVGACASAAFLSIGIFNARNEKVDEFDRLADAFVVNLQDAFKDYELFGLWIHESCRARDRAIGGGLGPLATCSRQEFRDLYEYILSVGLEFQSVQFMPYVSQEDREAVEAEARDFYEENYQHVNYSGIVGLFPKEGGGINVLPQEEHEFYWPVHYIEPVSGNEAAIDLDIYSSPTQQKTIQQAVKTWLPSVTDRLKLVQETDPNAYSIILHHPGIRLTTHNETDNPNGISLMVIRIPTLLAHTSSNSTDSAAFYIYDTTEEPEDPVFLGANTVHVQADNTVTFNGLPEVSLEELQANAESQKNTRFELREIEIADRTWAVAVVSLPNTYEPDTVFVIVGGIIIIMASFILGTCFLAHMNRVSKMNAIKSQAAQEKAEIIVDTARQQALTERELNDYIAHEVRNPLSSAIAALSFVTAATKEPNQTEEEKQVMRDDLHNIDASLQFINELLRNMLDMHRAANQQMKITLAPIDVMQDVLAPVASILYLRGNKVEIVTECPPDITVLGDRLRLKQIVLNLAMNSTKFVLQGFIRLVCIVKVGSGGPSVRIHVEDSGPGIPVEKRGNIFAKFQESLDLLSQGTGIGLCLCKHLTSLMKANLWLDEDYNSGIEGCPGTRFILDLQVPPFEEGYWDHGQSVLCDDIAEPVKKGPNGSPDLEASRTTCRETVAAVSVSDVPGSQSTNVAGHDVNRIEPLYQQPDNDNGDSQSSSTDTKANRRQQHIELPETLRVLFVDDDMILRKLFSRSLRRVAPGWNVQEAANGETALRMAEGDTFDVIFLDQYMSSIDKQLLGTETARALRAKGVTSRICGLSANDTEVPFLESGADCFLFKPFPCEKDTLRRLLFRLLYGPSERYTNSTPTKEDPSESP